MLKIESESKIKLFLECGHILSGPGVTRGTINKIYPIL